MTWLCDKCGTLATPANALVLHGGPIVHRDCADVMAPRAVPAPVSTTEAVPA